MAVSSLGLSLLTVVGSGGSRTRRFLGFVTVPELHHPAACNNSPSNSSRRSRAAKTAAAFRDPPPRAPRRASRSSNLNPIVGSPGTQYWENDHSGPTASQRGNDAFD